MKIKMNKNNKIRKIEAGSRIVYLDLLRIIAVFSMILLHVAAFGLHKVPVASFEWVVIIFYDSAVRFCVPLFIMISGSFFLDEKYNFSMKKLFGKNILRIVAAFLFWGTCYAVVSNIFDGEATGAALLVRIIKTMFLNPGHLWFLYTILGLYLIVPFLREICKSKKLAEYFLLLAFIFAFVLNFLKMNIWGDIANIVSTLEKQINLNFVLGYTGYFVLGHYLRQNNIGKKIRHATYIAGALSLIFTIFITIRLSIARNATVEALYEYILPNTLFVCIALFVFFKEKMSAISVGEKKAMAMAFLSKMSFGTYLVHIFINTIINRYFVTATSFNPIISIPLITALVFAISLGITYVISKVPVLYKYII